MNATTFTGLDVALRTDVLRGFGRLGLATNFTGTTLDLARNVDALLEAGPRSGFVLTALFGPEHGLNGSVQAGLTELDDVHDTGLPVHQTYLATPDQLDEMITRAAIDTLVFDMQDLGVRFFTYLWTMHDLMLAAARTGTPFVVLDRPNPLGGSVTAGPPLSPAHRSFVGRCDIPLRHGLTIGELARWFNRAIIHGATGRQVELTVVELAGWRRELTFDRTGRPWVPLSPNMPTLDTAFAFCGTGLFEGTNLSEGRGTTRPFELIGAPYIDARWLAALRDHQLPGVRFRGSTHVPTFHKYAGQTISGVQLHVTDRDAFDPISTALTMLGAAAELYPDHLAFLDRGERTDADENGYAIDRLWGSDDLRNAISRGDGIDGLVAPPARTAQAWPDDVLLY